MTHALAAAFLILSAALAPVAAAASTNPPNLDVVVAEVGAEAINYQQLNTMINSAPVVGLSIPALGTSERRQVALTLLDKAITANLLYLDAKRLGSDQDPDYRRDVARFSDAVLASIYQRRELIGKLPVSEDEIQAHFKANFKEDAELTDQVRTSIESALRKQKLTERQASARERLRQRVEVEIADEVLDAEGDAERADDAVAARIDGQAITWGEIKKLMPAAHTRASLAPMYVDEPEEREKRLNEYLDTRIMAEKARAAGLEQDPVYLARTSEYNKTRLINLHRNRLMAGWEPSADELAAFFAANQDRIASREMRKIQMLVVESEQQAADLKYRIDSGEISLHQAAMDYSIDPQAKQTLGDMGWVNKGSGFPELDGLTFSLEPGVLGGPVQSPAGWHLVKVLDLREGRHEHLDEPGTTEIIRRTLLHDRLDTYVVGLRKDHFEVRVHQDRLNQIFQQESAWIAALEAQQDPQAAEQRLQELREILQVPE